MKKVGIITFHASYNCGSMLQAYALQKVIKKDLKLDNELINFSNQGQQEMYSTFTKVRTLRNIAGNVIRLIFLPILKKSKADFESFISNDLKVASERFTETKELKAIDGNYDYYVCGSDQVWNSKAKDFDDAYFLSFVTKGKKVAYATSLGATNIIETDSAKSHYQKLVSDFSSISVREGNAKNIIEKITDKPVHITVDPTLLLSRNEWEKYIDLSTPLVEGKYIFYYAFNYNDKVNEFVEEMGKKYNMPVMIIDAKPWGPGAKFRYGFKLTKRFGPIAMLNLMKHATLVFTTSFHGTVFSTIFEKDFWFVKSDMHNKNDNRATYLLDQLGLIERFSPIDDLKKANLLTSANYEVSRQRIEVLKKESIEFLRSSLS